MKRDGILTGLVLGGVLGVTFSMIAVKAIKSFEGNSSKKKDNGQDPFQLKSLSKNKEKNGKLDERDDKTQENIFQKNVNEKDNTGGRELNDQTSEETTEKTEDNEAEMRNTEREVKKKSEKEGFSFGEDISPKVSFSKKIVQLEESLRKLREENTQ